ncbi:MAG TPA: hypothetical protein ACFE0H_09110 [Elainellaceae cyanobacterium]
MTRTSFVILRLAAGLAVGFWGLSKLVFVQNWVAPYEGAFYGNLPGNGALWVYLLGIIQLLIAIAIIFNISRRFAAWVAVGMSGINLIASILTVMKPENPILGNPAPLGIKLIWFFFDPIAILLLLAGVALLPNVNQVRSIPSSESPEFTAVGGNGPR